MRLCSVLLGAALLAGCAQDRTPATSAPQHPARHAVNSRCPIMSDLDIDGETFVTWQGHTVGFCCAECVTRWDRMSDAEKSAAIANIDGIDQGR